MSTANETITITIKKPDGTAGTVTLMVVGTKILGVQPVSPPPVPPPSPTPSISASPNVITQIGQQIQVTLITQVPWYFTTNISGDTTHLFSQAVPGGATGTWIVPASAANLPSITLTGWDHSAVDVPPQAVATVTLPVQIALPPPPVPPPSPPPSPPPFPHAPIGVILTGPLGTGQPIPGQIPPPSATNFSATGSIFPANTDLLFPQQYAGLDNWSFSVGLQLQFSFSDNQHNGGITMKQTSVVMLDNGGSSNKVVIQGTVDAVFATGYPSPGAYVLPGDVLRFTFDFTGYPFGSQTAFKVERIS